RLMEIRYREVEHAGRDEIAQVTACVLDHAHGHVWTNLRKALYQWYRNQTARRGGDAECNLSRRLDQRGCHVIFKRLQLPLETLKAFMQPPSGLCRCHPAPAAHE